MPSVPSKALRVLALLALFCNVAWGSNIPRYRYRLPPVKVDSRAFQVTSAPTRSVGRSRQLSATIPSSRLMGFTWYEYQHNGSTGRQIDELGGDIQVSWMRALSPDPTTRTVAWNRVPVAGSPQTYTLDNGDTVRFLQPGYWLLANGGFAGRRPGFTNVRNRPNGAAVVIFHDAGGPQYWRAELDLGPSWGFFAPQPSRAPNPPGIQYEEDAAIWPKQAIGICGSDLVHHGIGTWSGDSNEVWYWRGLMHSGSGNDSISWDVSQPTLIHPQDCFLTAVIEADGDEVSLVVGSQVSPVNADVGYYRSTDCGLTWGPFVNITNYNVFDPEGMWVELDAVYDPDGNLHVIWNTAPADGQSFPCNLYHWDEASGQIRMVTSAPWSIWGCENWWWQWSCGSGVSNLAIAEPSIAIKPAGLHGIAEELIISVWTQYGPTETDCATRDAIGTPGDCINGEIYMSVSSDDGRTWDRPQNISGTVTPDCLPGDCLSEGWVTAAAKADSGVYISYVEDHHAGAAVEGKGAWTENDYRVIIPETRLPIPNPVIAVFPILYSDLHADPVSGVPQTVELHVASVGTADLNYLVTVTGDHAGPAHVTVNGDVAYSGAVPAGSPPDVLTIAFHTTGLLDPSEHIWRLEVTSNDAENDPGQGGSPIDVHLQVFAASVWHDCVEDTLSTGLHRMQISSCLEMGEQGTTGTGFYNYADHTEWLTSGSPVITRLAGSDSLAYFNAYMTPLDRSRERNQSFRAQSELNVTRDTMIVVGDTQYVADVAWGSASTTDTTIGIDYEIIFPKSPGLQRGAVWRLTMLPLTGVPIEDVSLGVVADLDVVDAAQGGPVWANAGAGAEWTGWIGAQAGVIQGEIGFVPLNSWMAIFYLSTTTSCDIRGAAAAQVIANGNYLHPWGTYPADSLYVLFDRFGTQGSWSTDIHIDTGQEFDDVSVILVSESQIDLDPGVPVEWGFGIAVSDISEADLETTISSLRSAIVGSCCASMVYGDTDYSGGVTSADVIWLVNYVFKGGTEPLPCEANGDVNCTGGITSADIIYLVSYVFKNGEPPCDICEGSPLNCP